MAEIRVNSQSLREASSQLKNYLSTFNDVTSEVSQGLTALTATWEGSAFESFVSQVRSLEPTFEKYSQVISEYAQFLETSAEQYEAAETTAQSTTEDLTNNLFK